MVVKILQVCSPVGIVLLSDFFLPVPIFVVYLTLENLENQVATTGETCRLIRDKWTGTDNGLEYSPSRNNVTHFTDDARNIRRLIRSSREILDWTHSIRWRWEGYMEGRIPLDGHGLGEIN